MKAFKLVLYYKGGNKKHKIGTTMENTEKQRTSKQVFSEEDIDRITNNLRKLPEVKKEVKISKTELIRRLSTEIESLKARGYTMDQISESLRGEGIEINTPTLKSYLQRAKHATRSKAKVKPKTTKKSINTRNFYFP